MRRVELVDSEAGVVGETFRIDHGCALVDYEGWPRQVLVVGFGRPVELTAAAAVTTIGPPPKIERLVLLAP